jgi:hypothetical protein
MTLVQISEVVMAVASLDVQKILFSDRSIKSLQLMLLNYCVMLSNIELVRNIYIHIYIFQFYIETNKKSSMTIDNTTVCKLFTC